MVFFRAHLHRRLAQMQSRRYASAGETFSPYQYPLATSPPKVTKTTAAEARASLPAPPSKVSSHHIAKDPADPFDDLQTLSPHEQEWILASQKQLLPTTLQGSTKIGLEVPSYIPANVPAASLVIPETTITVLDNGLKVVSQETYSQMCAIGILGGFGSRHETMPGTAQLLELMAYQSTTSYSDSIQIRQTLQDWGATCFANSGREQTLWCLDLLRPNVEQGMDLLKQVTLEPLLQESEIENCKRAMHFQAEEFEPEFRLGEAMQAAAFGVDQQLGKPHIAPTELIDSLNATALHQYLEANLWKNPKDIVIAGAGIGHAELVDLAKFHFGGLHQSTPERSVVSIYRGGECKLNIPTNDDMTRIGVAVNVGGWHSDDLVPGCVLQTLLGGGNAFSAGGPGKGMYSRLYRQVLNRYYWANSSEAFTLFHVESGLFGISGSSTKGDKCRDAVRVFTEHLLKLAVDPVSDEELDRARNMLKNNVLMQLESRLVLFEDMARQVQFYGFCEDNAAVTAKIDAVTKEDVQQLMIRALQKPPSLAAVGTDVNFVPSYNEVKSWFA